MYFFVCLLVFFLQDCLVINVCTVCNLSMWLIHLNLSILIKLSDRHHHTVCIVHCWFYLQIYRHWSLAAPWDSTLVSISEYPILGFVCESGSYESFEALVISRDFIKTESLKYVSLAFKILLFISTDFSFFTVKIDA